MVSPQVYFSSEDGSLLFLHSNPLMSLFPPTPCALFSHTSSLPFIALLPVSLAFFPLNSSDIDWSQGTEQISSLASYVMKCVDRDRKKRGIDSETTGEVENGSGDGPDSLPSICAPATGTPTYLTQEDRQRSLFWANQPKTHRVLQFFSICYFKSIFSDKWL